MPVLLKTIDYLLNLLDQPYDEGFLGLYNFLWDRMRAIRMDLRMQHIFNQGACPTKEQLTGRPLFYWNKCDRRKGRGGGRSIMSYPGFGKESGPSVPPISQPVFGGHTNAFLRPPSSSLASSAYATSSSPPRPSIRQKLFYRDLDAPLRKSRSNYNTCCLTGSHQCKENWRRGRAAENEN
ncbi:hypothetical protein K1719_036703 [Acacia pycnantha]|nr:hypothetical protein K1719_036703 [Acacia pycnantha]